MPAPRPVFGHEPGRLQGLLDEGVAEAHAVLPARQLMEMADVEALVAVAIQGQQALDLRDRRPLGRRRLPAAIEQAVIAVALELQAQAPDAAGAAAENIGGAHSLAGGIEDDGDMHEDERRQEEDEPSLRSKPRIAFAYRQGRAGRLNEMVLAINRLGSTA